MAAAAAAAKAETPEAAADQQDAGFDKVKRRISGKKLVLFAGVPVLLLGVLGGLWFTPLALPVKRAIGLTPHAATEEAHKAPAPPPRQLTFMDLPDMIVNLNVGGRQSAYLKLKVALELDDPALVPKLKVLEPRIIDNFQIYLRDLRREDLEGSAGMARLKEELLMRINVAVRPAKVNDVLFNEILVQ